MPVMLTEYFDESLVLLKHLVCVPYEALHTFKLNSREYPKPPLNLRQTENFNKFFKQDLMVYDYFEKVMQKKIATFGTEVWNYV